MSRLPNHPILDNDYFLDQLSKASVDPSVFARNLERAGLAFDDDDVLSPLFTGQASLGPIDQQAQTTVGRKIRAAAALENVSGRGVWNLDRRFGMFDWLLGEAAPYSPSYVDPSSRRLMPFDLDGYIQSNQGQLANSPEGKVILRNYSGGYYDGMNGQQFFAAIGFDIAEDSLRADLASSTGNGIVDFGSTVIGAAIDPTALAGGALALRGAGTAARLKSARSIAEAWKRTNAYRKLVATSNLGIKGAIVEGAKDAAAVGVFSEASLQALDRERELADFAENAGANILADVLLTSAFSWLHRKPKPGQSVGEKYNRFVKNRARTAEGYKAKLSALADSDMPVAEAAIIDGELSAALAADPTIAKANAEAKAHYGQSVETGSLGDAGATAEINSIPDEPLVKTTVKAEQGVEKVTILEKKAATDNAAPNGDGPSATDSALPADTGQPSQSGAVDAGRRGNALTPEAMQLLRRVFENQNRVIAEPIDTELAVDAMNAIASRDVQVFNYGRLDAMGLRKVKIEQPVQAIINKIENNGLDTTLENIFAELKKMSPEEAAKFWEAHEPTAPTFKALQAIYKSDQAASQTMLDMADALLAEGQNSLGGQRFVLGASVKRLRPTATSSLSAPIIDELDYMPDRSNDSINKWAVKFAKFLQSTPLRSLIDADKPDETRGLFAFHRRFAMRKFLLSDNPIHVGLSNTLLDPLLPMKGQTKGTIKSKFSVERIQRQMRHRTRLAQGFLYQQFRNYARALDLDLGVRSNVAAAAGQPQFLPQQFWRQAERFYDDLERMRVQVAALNIEPDKFPEFIRQNHLAGIMEHLQDVDAETAANSGIVEAFANSLTELDRLGLIRDVPDAKLTKWMNADQRRVLKATTSIRLDPEEFTLEQLDQLMTILFVRPETSPAAGAAPPAWQGLKRFIDLEQFDESTGQFVRKYGVVTLDEIQSAAKDAARARELVRSIVGNFNADWGGLVPINKIDRLSQYLQTIDKPASINFSAMRTLENVSRFLERFELAEQLTDRLRELEKLKIERTFSPDEIDQIRVGAKEIDTILSKRIRQFDSMRNRLRQAMSRKPQKQSGDVLDIATPELFHFWAKYSTDAIDAIAEEAREYGIRKGWDAKKLQRNERESDALAGHLKEIFGLSPRIAAEPFGRFVISTAQSFTLGRSGVTQLLDAGKAIAQGMAYADVGGIKGAVSGFHGLVANARKTGMSDADLGFVLESMSTHLEDLQQVASRRLEDASGDIYFDQGPDTGLEKFGQFHRWLVGKASAMEFVTDLSKMSSILHAHSLLGNKQGLVHIARQIVDLIDHQGLTPIEAAKRVRSVGGVDISTFHGYGKIAANLSHAEIRDLDELLQAAETRKAALAGRLGAPAGTIDTIELPKGAGEKERQLLRKYGQLLDYWVERELLNIPTASSNLTIASPHGFINKAMTMFLRTTMAALDNHGVGQANVSLLYRMPLAVYMTSLSAAVIYLKAMLAGDRSIERIHDKWDGGTLGQAELLFESLDYSGYLGIAASKSANFLLDLQSPSFFDRANAGEYQLLSPVQSFVLNMGRGIAGLSLGAAEGEEATLSQQRAMRKLLSLNLLDSTIGGIVRRGMLNKLTEHTEIEEIGEFLFPEGD